MEKKELRKGFRMGLRAVLGAVGVGADTAEKVIHKLMKRGAIMEEDVKSLVTDITTAVSEGKEDFEKKVKGGINEIAKKVEKATRKSKPPGRRRVKK